MELPQSEVPVAETAIERKRRLRRERILNNSESRMRRILGNKNENDAPAPNFIEGERIEIDSSNIVANASPTPNRSLDGVESISNGLPTSSAVDDSTLSSPPETSPPNASKGHLELNGIHSQLPSHEPENLDPNSLPTPGEGQITSGRALEVKTLEGGDFGFNAFGLKKRTTHQLADQGVSGVAGNAAGGSGLHVIHSPTKDILALEDEEELLAAKNLLLRDHRQSRHMVDQNAVR